jgi:dTDP-4-amino-4,6-dideoxygalactose transaminase
MLTTGQGGAVLTDDADLENRIDDLVRYDNREVYEERFNYAMSDLNAALGRSQLKLLPGFIKRRREIADRYNSALAGTVAACPDLSGHVAYRYLIRLPECASDFLEKMVREGIEAKRPVYQPLHRYRGLPDSAFPGATAIHENGASLPIYPSLTDSEVDRVADAAVRILKELFA